MSKHKTYWAHVIQNLNLISKFAPILTLPNEYTNCYYTKTQVTGA